MKRNTKHIRLSNARLRQNLLALGIILLMGGMGLHFLVRSHAAAATTYWLNVSPCGSSGNTYQLCLTATVYNVDPNTTYTISWSGSLDDWAPATVANLSPTSYTFNITTGASPAVAAAGNTYINAGTYLTLTVTSGCTAVAYTGNSSLGSFNTAPETGPFGPDCHNGGDDNGDDGAGESEAQEGENEGSIGHGIGKTGTNDGTTGTGSGKTGTGSGGGSSGSNATKQGNQPNSTPSSSPQGDKSQTKLNPSPFYDGKEYNRGSDSDSGGVLDFFSSGKTSTATKLWRIGLAGLLAVGLVFAGYWWWRKQVRKPQ